MNVNPIVKPTALTQLVGVKSSSLTGISSSQAYGHTFMEGNRGIINAASLAFTAEDALTTIFEDMYMIRDTIMQAQYKKVEIEIEEEVSKEENQALIDKTLKEVETLLQHTELSRVKLVKKEENLGESNIHQGQMMMIENSSLENLNLVGLNIMDDEALEKIDQALHQVFVTMSSREAKKDTSQEMWQKGQVQREVFFTSDKSTLMAAVTLLGETSQVADSTNASNKMKDVEGMDLSGQILETKRSEILERYKTPIDNQPFTQKSRLNIET